MNEYPSSQEYKASTPWDGAPTSHQPGSFEGTTGATSDYSNLTASSESALTARPESSAFGSAVEDTEVRSYQPDYGPLDHKQPWEMTATEYRAAGLPHVDELSAIQPRVVRVGDVNKSADDAYYSTLHVAHRLRKEHANELKKVEEAVAQGVPPEEAKKGLISEKSILVVDYGPGTGERSPFVQNADPRDYKLVHSSVKDAHLILGNMPPSDTIRTIANTAAKEDPAAAATYVSLMESIAPYITTTHPDTGKPSLTPDNLRMAFKALDDSTTVHTNPVLARTLKSVIGTAERQNKASSIAALSSHLDTSFRSDGKGVMTNTKPGEEASPVQIFSIGVPAGGGVTHATDVSNAGNLTVAVLSASEWGQPREFVGLNFDCLPPEQQAEVLRILKTQDIHYDITMGTVNQENASSLDDAMTFAHSPIGASAAKAIEQALPPVSRKRVKSTSGSINASDGASVGVGTNTGSEYGTAFDKTGGSSDNSGDSTGLSYNWQQSAEIEHNAPAVDASELSSGMQPDHILVVDAQGNIRGYFNGEDGRLAPGSPIERRAQEVDVLSPIGRVAIDQQNIRRQARGLPPLPYTVDALSFLPDTDQLSDRQQDHSQLYGTQDLPELDSGLPHPTREGVPLIGPEVRARPKTPVLKEQQAQSPAIEASALARSFNEATRKSIYGPKPPGRTREFIGWVHENKWDASNGGDAAFKEWFTRRFPGMKGNVDRYIDSLYKKNY